MIFPILPIVSFAVDFGHGGGRAHEQDVNCVGAESNLLQCIESGSGMRSLSTECIRPAGVICEGKIFVFQIILYNDVTCS